MNNWINLGLLTIDFNEIQALVCHDLQITWSFKSQTEITSKFESNEDRDSVYNFVTNLLINSPNNKETPCSKI